MLRTLSIFFGLIPSILRSRRSLLLEVLALRQQLAILKTKHPQPKLAIPDRLFWVILRRLWSGWKEALVIVRPETVIRWHRAGFNLDLDVGFTQEKEARQTANSKRSAGSNLSYGGREPDVGSATDSWRVEDARLRGLRANRAALDAEGPAESGAGQTMGGRADEIDS